MPPSKTVFVDILLIVLIGLSVAMSSIVVSKIISSQSVFMTSNSSTLDHAQSEQPSDDNANKERAPSYEGGYGSLTPPVDDRQGSGSALLSQSETDSLFYTRVYESAQYMLPITWGAVAGTLIWRGKVRSSWCKQGYDYDTFRLVARTRGSPTRVKLLNSVATAKNRLQLANELDVDWKTVDNHMEILARSGLVQEKAIVGTTRYYVLTEHGRRVLELLADGHGTMPQQQEPPLGALRTLSTAG